MLKQDYYNNFFEIGQQKINFNFFQLGLPDDDPVYILKNVMEELDFSGLLVCYSDKRGTEFNPITLYAVVTYVNMRGVRAVDRIVGLYQRDLVFIRLIKGQKPQRDVFYDFKGKKPTEEVLDELSYQLMRRLEKEGPISLKKLYIDGTKIEANANRYTFIWRCSLNYYPAGLLDMVDALYTEYNTLLLENGYNPKCNLGNTRMFVIKGMNKARKVIEGNRKRKLTKHKKIPNNTIAETDYCSPLEIWKLQKNLIQITQGKGIGFIYGKGKHKPEIQKLYEELEECGTRLTGYEECFETMGKSRNSYFKIDMEVTFVWTKEDHMLNGRLKPAYNVRIAVENYFIVYGCVSNDRTDYHTLIPVLEKHRKTFENMLEVMIADSGYCSEKGLLYLKENGIRSYIKLQEYEERKTRAYKEDIGKYYTMTYAIFEDERYYICHDGRELRHIRTGSKEQDGYAQTVEVYGCADCSGCEHKSKCLYKYNTEEDPDRNKVMKISEGWEELWGESHTDIQSEEGILKRQTHPIQIEGHFGDIKESENFRRLNCRSEEKVYREFMLYETGRNMMKYHRFLHYGIGKYEGKKEQKAAQQTEHSVKTKQRGFAP